MATLKTSQKLVHAKKYILIRARCGVGKAQPSFMRWTSHRNGDRKTIIVHFLETTGQCGQPMHSIAELLQTLLGTASRAMLTRSSSC
jgi:hypothetical protein